MVALTASLCVLVVALAAEWLHARRVRRVAKLAFGPTGRPRPWVRWSIPARALGLALVTWGLLTLYNMEPDARDTGEAPDAAMKRLIIALDVSPSMQLVDAGPMKDQSRAKRAAEVVNTLLDRISLDLTRVTVIAFYTGARPVVIDTRDPAIVKNIFNDLPLHYSFNAGKTQMLDGVAKSFEIARPWREKSATLLVVSDGDSVPYTGMPTIPPAVARSIVVGVGDVAAGKFIDGHNSRQDAVALRQLATRLRGTYHNANDRNVPAALLSDISGLLPLRRDRNAGQRELAVAAAGLGGLFVSGVPLATALFGSAWRPGRRATKVQALGISPTPQGAAHA